MLLDVQLARYGQNVESPHVHQCKLEYNRSWVRRWSTASVSDFRGSPFTRGGGPNPSQKPPALGVRDVGDTIKRSSLRPPSTSAARFTQAQSIRQEVVRDELEEDLLKHSQRGVWRNTQLVDVKINDGDQEYPVVARVESIAHRPRSGPSP